MVDKVLTIESPRIELGLKDSPASAVGIYRERDLWRSALL